MSRKAYRRADRRLHLPSRSTARWIVPIVIAVLIVWLVVAACQRVADTPAPATPGSYREAWGPLIEGRNWLPALHPLDLRIEVTHDEN